jgi:hypothetical protein
MPSCFLPMYSFFLLYSIFSRAHINCCNCIFATPLFPRVCGGKNRRVGWMTNKETSLLRCFVCFSWFFNIKKRGEFLIETFLPLHHSILFLFFFSFFSWLCLPLSFILLSIFVGLCHFALRRPPSTVLFCIHVFYFLASFFFYFK